MPLRHPGDEGLARTGVGRAHTMAARAVIGARLRYALLLYLDPERAQATTPEDARAELAAYAVISDDLTASGELRGGEAFMPSDSAIAVREVDGVAVTEPVVAGDLELAGFFIVECDEVRAQQIAATMPVAAHGQVEVRPLLQLPGW